MPERDANLPKLAWRAPHRHVPELADHGHVRAPGILLHTQGAVLEVNGVVVVSDREPDFRIARLPGHRAGEPHGTEQHAHGPKERLRQEIGRHHAPIGILAPADPAPGIPGRGASRAGAEPGKVGPAQAGRLVAHQPPFALQALLESLECALVGARVLGNVVDDRAVRTVQQVGNAVEKPVFGAEPDPGPAARQRLLARRADHVGLPTVGIDHGAVAEEPLDVVEAIVGVGDVAHAQLDDPLDRVGGPRWREHGRPARVEFLDPRLVAPQVAPARLGDGGGLGHVLVADAPHHDRGVVPVAPHAALDAKQGRFDPLRVVDVVGAPINRQFLQQIDAEFVAKFGQAARPEEVGTDRVDVRPLHQRQVSAQPFAWRMHAELGMVGQVVHPAELDGTAVQPRTFGAKFEAAKSRAVADRPHRLPVQRQRQRDAVEVRKLVVPQRRRLDVHGQRRLVAASGRKVHGTGRGSHAFAIGRRHGQPQRPRGWRRAVVRQCDRARYRAELAFQVHAADEVVVGHMAGLDREERGGLRQAGELHGVAHHIHLHEPVAAHQPHGDDGRLPRDHQVRDIELDRSQPAHVLAEQRAVTVKPSGRVDGVKAQQDTPSAPGGRHDDLSTQYGAVLGINVAQRHPVPVGNGRCLGVGIGIEYLARLGHDLPVAVIGRRGGQFGFRGVKGPAPHAPVTIERQRHGVIGQYGDLGFDD